MTLSKVFTLAFIPLINPTYVGPKKYKYRGSPQSPGASGHKGGLALQLWRSPAASILNAFNIEDLFFPNLSIKK